MLWDKGLRLRDTEGYHPNNGESHGKENAPGTFLLCKVYFGFEIWVLELRVSPFEPEVCVVGLRMCVFY